MLEIKDRGEVEMPTTPQVVKLVLCSNHNYLTYRGECYCAGSHGEYERFAIAGTDYGYLHRTSGDVHLWNSASGAYRRLRSYKATH